MSPFIRYSLLSGYSDFGAYWLSKYESPTFKEDVESLWQVIKPFYQQLHAYVRAKLRAFYGEDKVPRNQPIPAHLLGITEKNSLIETFLHNHLSRCHGSAQMGQH